VKLTAVLCFTPDEYLYESEQLAAELAAGVLSTERIAAAAAAYSNTLFLMQSVAHGSARFLKV
jgi:hypothetical protein